MFKNRRPVILLAVLVVVILAAVLAFTCSVRTTTEGGIEEVASKGV